MVRDIWTKEESVGVMSDNLTRRQSYMTAKEYFHKKKEGANILPEDFDLVYWEGMRKFMKKKQRQFRNWLTKQSNGACACNDHLFKWKDDTKDEYPSCGKQEPPHT